VYGTQTHTSAPKNIFAERGHSFWRYTLQVQLTTEEQQVKFSISDLRVHGSFWVPGIDQSMRVMFHSCNGFSVKIPPDAFAGPSLWNDVSNIFTGQHATRSTVLQVLRGEFHIPLLLRAV
jgi:hypothetical protein